MFCYQREDFFIHPLKDLLQIYLELEFTLNFPGGGIFDALIAQVAVTAAKRVK